MKIIDVPDVQAPTAELCWKPSPKYPFQRCDRRKDHGGDCIWKQSRWDLPDMDQTGPR